MLALHELTGAFARLAECEDAEEFDQALRDLEGDIAQKVSNICGLLRSLESEAEALKAEEQRLRARRYGIDYRHEGLKRYLVRCLTEAGLNKFRDPLFTVTVMPPRKRAVVVDDTAIPEQYVRVERHLLGDAIKKALEQGYEVPGAQLVDGEPFVVIR